MSRRFQFLEITNPAHQQDSGSSAEPPYQPQILKKSLDYYFLGKYTEAVKLLGRINIISAEDRLKLSLMNILILLNLNDWKHAAKLYHNLSSQIETFHLPYEIIGLYLCIPRRSVSFMLKQITLLQHEVNHDLIQWSRITVLIFHRQISCREARKRLQSIPYSEDLAPFILLTIELLTHYKRYHPALLCIDLLLEHQEDNYYLYYLRALNYYQLGLIKAALKSIEFTLSLENSFSKARDLEAKINNRGPVDIIWHRLKKLLLFRS